MFKWPWAPILLLVKHIIHVLSFSELKMLEILLTFIVGELCNGWVFVHKILASYVQGHNNSACFGCLCNHLEVFKWLQLIVLNLKGYLLNKWTLERKPKCYFFSPLLTEHLPFFPSRFCDLAINIDIKKSLLSSSLLFDLLIDHLSLNSCRHTPVC